MSKAKKVAQVLDENVLEMLPPAFTQLFHNLDTTLVPGSNEAAVLVELARQFQDAKHEIVTANPELQKLLEECRAEVGDDVTSAFLWNFLRSRGELLASVIN